MFDGPTRDVFQICFVNSRLNACEEFVNATIQVYCFGEMQGEAREIGFKKLCSNFVEVNLHVQQQRKSNSRTAWSLFPRGSLIFILSTRCDALVNTK